jgi:acyl carrier protein
MGLDTVEFILWAEKEFQIRISNEEAANLLTVGELCAYIHRRLLIQGGVKGPTEPEIFVRVKAQLSTQFGIAPELISHDSQFVRDLGLD